MFIDYQVNNKEDLEKLNKVASKQDFPIYAECGNSQIDARSMLALFIFLGKCIKLVAPDHVSAEDFIKAIRDLT